MAPEPIESQRDETPMEPRTRPCCEQPCNERTRNAEPSQSACHVDPVGRRTDRSGHTGERHRRSRRPGAVSSRRAHSRRAQGPPGSPRGGDGPAITLLRRHAQRTHPRAGRWRDWATCASKLRRLRPGNDNGERGWLGDRSRIIDLRAIRSGFGGHCDLSDATGDCVYRRA